MTEVKALNVGKQLQVPQPKNAPFFKLPRNAIMLAPSGAGRSHAHIRTLIDPDKPGNLFDKYVVMSPNCWVDPA